jgi:hypothetical protein
MDPGEIGQGVAIQARPGMASTSPPWRQQVAASSAAPKRLGPVNTKLNTICRAPRSSTAAANSAWSCRGQGQGPIRRHRGEALRSSGPLHRGEQLIEAKGCGIHGQQHRIRRWRPRSPPLEEQEVPLGIEATQSRAEHQR